MQINMYCIVLCCVVLIKGRNLPKGETLLIPIAWINLPKGETLLIPIAWINLPKGETVLFLVARINCELETILFLVARINPGADIGNLEREGRLQELSRDTNQSVYIKQDKTT